MTAPDLPQKQAVLPPITDPTVHVEIDRLARRYVDAGGMGMELLSAVGGGAEVVLNRLPDFAKRRLDRVTLSALTRAVGAAGRSRKMTRDRGDLFNRVVSSVSGAAGGLAGLPGAMIEMPVTITMLLRAILDIAAEHGFDPDSEETRMDAIRVFAAAGPMADDDGTDLALLAAKMSITGQTLQGLIARVAPRLSAVLGQKLAAQAAPVFGAVAGATINYTFARYYQELARVQFGLLRLSREAGIPREALVERLQLRVEDLQSKKPRR